jgi:hypothetical protein
MPTIYLARNYGGGYKECVQSFVDKPTVKNPPTLEDFKLCCRDNFQQPYAFIDLHYILFKPYKMAHTHTYT